MPEKQQEAFCEKEAPKNAQQSLKNIGKEYQEIDFSNNQNLPQVESLLCKIDALATSVDTLTAIEQSDFYRFRAITKLTVILMKEGLSYPARELTLPGVQQKVLAILPAVKEDLAKAAAKAQEGGDSVKKGKLEGIKAEINEMEKEAKIDTQERKEKFTQAEGKVKKFLEKKFEDQNTEVTVKLNYRGNSNFGSLEVVLLNTSTATPRTMFFKLGYNPELKTMGVQPDFTPKPSDPINAEELQRAIDE